MGRHGQSTYSSYYVFTYALNAKKKEEAFTCG